MAALPPTTIVCHVGSLAADATTVDALARLQLAARRAGHELFVRDASRELCALLDLCGLAGVLRVEPGGQPEERE